MTALRLPPEDLDFQAIGDAIEQQVTELPPTTQQHVLEMWRLGAEGGALVWEERGVRCVWSGIEVAYVPYDLVRRLDPSTIS